MLFSGAGSDAISTARRRAAPSNRAMFPHRRNFRPIACDLMSVALTAPPQFQGGRSGAEGRRLKTSVSKTPPCSGSTPQLDRMIAATLFQLRWSWKRPEQRITIEQNYRLPATGSVPARGGQTMLSGSSQAKSAGAAAALAGQTAQRPARRTRSRLGFFAGLAEAG